MFHEKHVHVFPDSRTCFLRFTYVFSRKHDRDKNGHGKYTISKRDSSRKEVGLRENRRYTVIDYSFMIGRP